MRETRQGWNPICLPPPPASCPTPTRGELPSPGAGRPPLWMRFKHLKMFGVGWEVLKSAPGDVGAGEEHRVERNSSR